MNALSLFQYELSLCSIPTSSRKLDEALGNGVRLGTITEFAGRNRTGKTQLILQMIFNTVLPKPLGVIDGEAVYISTQPGSFCPDRIYPIIDPQVVVWRNKLENTPAAKLFTRNIALSRIIYEQVHSLRDLVETVCCLPKLAKRSRNVILQIHRTVFPMIQFSYSF